MADSAQQIFDSIDGTGLRDKLGEALQAAIARARSRCQEWTDTERESIRRQRRQLSKGGFSKIASSNNKDSDTQT